jgi:hypothetical protein
VNGANLTLAWGAPENLSGTQIVGYEVSYKLNSADAWAVYSGTGSGFTATTILWKAPLNTWYANALFRVRAITMSPAAATPGAAVYSDYVTVSAAFTGAASVVNTPTISAAANSVALTWTAPTDLAGGTIVEYRVETSSNAGGTWALAGTTTSTSLTINGLNNGTNYLVRITPVTTQGAGASTVMSATPFTMPSAPSSTRAIAGDSFLTVFWSAPASNGGMPISGYQLDLCNAASCTWTTYVRSTGSPLSNTYTFSGLTNGTQYKARVSAVTGACDETATDTTASCNYYGAIAIATPGTVPTAPQTLSAIVACTNCIGNCHIVVGCTVVKRWSNHLWLHARAKLKWRHNMDNIVAKPWWNKRVWHSGHVYANKRSHARRGLYVPRDSAHH